MWKSVETWKEVSTVRKFLLIQIIFIDIQSRKEAIDLKQIMQLQNHNFN